MQKTKALSWLFPECVRKVEKQSTKAGRFLVFGAHAQEIPRGHPEIWLTLPIRSLPHDLVMGGIPHAGSRQLCFLMSIVWLVVQSSSHDPFFATLWTTACQASPSFTISQSLLKLKSIESVMPSHTLLFPSPPAFSLYQHQLYSGWES